MVNFRATDKEALSQIYSRIDELERSEIEVRNFTEYKELFHGFFACIIFSSNLFCTKKIYFQNDYIVIFSNPYLFL